jgi:SAM-dependent methyltransferase
MRLDVGRLRQDFAQAQRGKKSRHDAHDRLRPSTKQYDYLNLRTLTDAIITLLDEIPVAHGGKALDVGAERSPYRPILEARGYSLETLDISADSEADHIGTVEATGLPDAGFDVAICTQVLEHSAAPWQGMRELRRILKPGGHLILTVPHVWFYHPHPSDNWRFTQEGVLRLCELGQFLPLTLLAQGGTALSLAQILNFSAYGVLGTKGWPIYWIINHLGMALDRVAPNSLFSHNFACLALVPP